MSTRVGLRRVRRMRRRRALGAVGLAVLVFTGTGSVVAQDQADDLREQREQNRRDAASVAAELDALTAEDADLLAALEALDAHISLQEGRIQASGEAIESADHQAEEARRLAAEIGTEIETVRAQLRVRAVDAFVGPRNDAVEELDAANVMEATLRRAFLDQVLGDEYELIDQLRAKVAQQEAAERLAESLLAEAEAERDSLELRLAELAEARVEAEGLRVVVHGRIAEWEAVGSDIREADRAVAAEIRRLEEEAARQAAEEEARRLAEEEAEADAEQPDQGAGEGENADDADGEEADTDDERVVPSGDFAFTHRPVPGRMVSPFGDRVHPIFGTIRSHYGMDLDGSTGDPIVAAAPGTVLSAGWIRGYGYTVVISHGGGYTTLYAHMTDVGVSAGNSVGGGETIGWVGSTGWSTGSHLHLEVRFDGAAIDPALFLP